jgi:hypothetical protein
VVIWFIFPRFGILDQEKSGNPAPSQSGIRDPLRSIYTKKLISCC